jgi:hypothetical protein
MLALFTLPTNNEIVRIGLIILGVILLWSLLRLLLRLTLKLFACGFGLILIVAIAVVFLRVFAKL